MENILNQILYKINEDTAMSNITYLPATLGAVTNALKSLAKFKKDWNIEILEDKKFKRVMFEDSLCISVPHIWWNEFNSLFDNKVMHGPIKLDKYLVEAEYDRTNELKAQIKPALTKLYETRPFDQLEQTVYLWKSWFKVSKLRRPNAVICVENKYKDIQQVSAQIIKAYGDDIGGMEMFIEAASNEKPLNTFEVFKKFDFLYGSRCVSVYNKLPITFECTLDMTYLMNQSIIVEDKEVAAGLDGIKGAKVVNNVLYPISGSFNNKFFKELKFTIDDIYGGEEKEFRNA